jgi:dCTP deaminase
VILPDHAIRHLCQQEAMVVPFNPELLNPASLDVTLGWHVMEEVPDTDEMQLVDITYNTAEDPYLLQPGCFVLAETQEIFNLPDTVAAQFVLKSSRARQGFEHLLAGYCDPGWHGSRLTMEITNARKLRPLALWPGMKIGQMVFFQMAQRPDRDYSVTGHYNGHLRVMPCVQAA